MGNLRQNSIQVQPLPQDATQFLTPYTESQTEAVDSLENYIESLTIPLKPKQKIRSLLSETFDKANSIIGAVLQEPTQKRTKDIQEEIKGLSTELMGDVRIIDEFKGRTGQILGIKIRDYLDQATKKIEEITKSSEGKEIIYLNKKECLHKLRDQLQGNILLHKKDFIAIYKSEISKKELVSIEVVLNTILITVEEYLDDLYAFGLLQWKGFLHVLDKVQSDLADVLENKKTVALLQLILENSKKTLQRTGEYNYEYEQLITNNETWPDFLKRFHDIVLEGRLEALEMKEIENEWAIPFEKKEKNAAKAYMKQKKLSPKDSFSMDDAEKIAEHLNENFHAALPIRTAQFILKTFGTSSTEEKSLEIKAQPPQKEDTSTVQEASKKPAEATNSKNNPVTQKKILKPLTENRKPFLKDLSILNDAEIERRIEILSLIIHGTIATAALSDWGWSIYNKPNYLRRLNLSKKKLREMSELLFDIFQNTTPATYMTEEIKEDYKEEVLKHNAYFQGGSVENLTNGFGVHFDISKVEAIFLEIGKGLLKHTSLNKAALNKVMQKTFSTLKNKQNSSKQGLIILGSSIEELQEAKKYVEFSKEQYMFKVDKTLEGTYDKVPEVFYKKFSETPSPELHPVEIIALKDFLLSCESWKITPDFVLFGKTNDAYFEQLGQPCPQRTEEFYEQLAAAITYSWLPEEKQNEISGNTPDEASTSYVGLNHEDAEQLKTDPNLTLLLDEVNKQINTGHQVSKKKKPSSFENIEHTIIPHTALKAMYERIKNTNCHLLTPEALNAFVSLVVKDIVHRWLTAISTFQQSKNAVLLTTAQKKEIMSLPFVNAILDVIKENYITPGTWHAINEDGGRTHNLFVVFQNAAEPLKSSFRRLLGKANFLTVDHIKALIQAFSIEENEYEVDLSTLERATPINKTTLQVKIASALRTKKEMMPKSFRGKNSPSGKEAYTPEEAEFIYEMYFEQMFSEDGLKPGMISIALNKKFHKGLYHRTPQEVYLFITEAFPEEQVFPELLDQNATHNQAEKTAVNESPKKEDINSPEHSPEETEEADEPAQPGEEDTPTEELPTQKEEDIPANEKPETEKTLSEISEQKTSLSKNAVEQFLTMSLTNVKLFKSTIQATLTPVTSLYDSIQKLASHFDLEDSESISPLSEIADHAKEYFQTKSAKGVNYNITHEDYEALSELHSQYQETILFLEKITPLVEVLHTTIEQSSKTLTPLFEEIKNHLHSHTTAPEKLMEFGDTVRELHKELTHATELYNSLPKKWEFMNDNLKALVDVKLPFIHHKDYGDLLSQKALVKIKDDCTLIEKYLEDLNRKNVLRISTPESSHFIAKTAQAPLTKEEESERISSLKVEWARIFKTNNT